MSATLKKDAHDVWTRPCPKCGDDTFSRQVVHGWYPTASGSEVEALRVDCIACGYDMGIFHPMDHEQAGEKIDG